MIVSELIYELKKFNPESIIQIEMGWSWDGICDNIEVKEKNNIVKITSKDNE